MLLFMILKSVHSRYPLSIVVFHNLKYVNISYVVCLLPYIHPHTSSVFGCWCSKVYKIMAPDYEVTSMLMARYKILK